MSTDPSSSVNFQNGFALSDGGDNIRRGLAVVGIILLFLFSLVVLKVLCNMFIDVVILRDGDSLMRTFSDIRRLVCPCWHPRTEPSAPSTELPTSNMTTIRHNNDRIDMENLLVGMTPDQKKELLAATLTSKTATKEDIVAWKTSMETSQKPVVAIAEAVIPEGAPNCTSPSKQSSSEHNNNNGLLCPICIHDIQVDEQICYSGLCHHVFHRECLSSWLSTHSRICPYCRQEILTQDMLEEAYRIKLDWLENATSGSDDSSDESSASSSDSEGSLDNALTVGN